MVARFADCQLHLDARRLVRNGREVHLSPKAFELLKLLLDSRPRAMSKSELLDRVWPGVFVSEGSLAKAVNEIRDGIGLAAGAQAIRTIHRFGYAFAAEVTMVEEEDASHRSDHQVDWWLIGDQREFPLTAGRHVVGRGPDVSVPLASPRVSRRHAEIVVERSWIAVHDLGSKNGTFVNSLQRADAVPLVDGDEIRIGPFTLIVRRVTGGATETEIEPTR